MKEKIIIFIVGLLVGGVIASGAFLIYTKTTDKNCSAETTQMNGENPPEKPSGESGEPPEMSNGENGQPPEKPDSENSSSKSSKKEKKSSDNASTDSQSSKESNSKTKENN